MVPPYGLAAAKRKMLDGICNPVLSATYFAGCRLPCTKRKRRGCKPRRASQAVMAIVKGVETEESLLWLLESCDAIFSPKD